MTSPTETPIYTTRLHWMAYAVPVAWLIFALILFFQSAGESVNALAIFIAVAAIATILVRRQFKVTVYNDRVRIRNLFATRDILRSQIEMVDCVRPALAFGNYGTVMISGTGMAQVPLRLISAPQRLRDVILREKSDNKICPQCAETIKAAALVCRYCGYKFGQ